MRFCLLSLLSLVLYINVLCQEFSYTHYTVKDGLAGSVVYCAAEDREGFLWFGTESGLSRFDGTHFQNFTTAHGLPDNEVLKLFVDSKNRIWIASFRNSICYYWKGQIHNQENDPTLHSLDIGSDINSVVEDKYGNIIMAEPTAINIIGPDQKTKKITRIDGHPLLVPIGGGLNHDSLFTFFMSRSFNDLRQYTITQNNLAFTGKRTFIGTGINYSLLSHDVNIFRNKDTLHFIPATSRPFGIATPHNFNAISKIDDSLIALNTTSGVFMYNLHTQKETNHFLKEQSINAVIRDSEGNLWFMCAGEGIYRIGSLAFRNSTFGENRNLSVTSIQKINGCMYIGTERSFLWRSDHSLQQINKLKISWHINNLGRILSIEPINKNSLLLGTDGGLVRLDHLNQDNLIEYLSVKSVTPSKGNFLISTAQGVGLFNATNLKMYTSIWTGRSVCSYQQDSLFYIGTISGLYSLVPGKKPRFLGDSYPVFRTRIAAIRSSPDGTLWIGTCGQGIAGYKDGRLLFSLTEKDGLSSDVCRSICISGNDIWVGTDKGLNRIRKEPTSFRITKFGSADGLSSDIINTVYVDGNEVYVGSANGLTHFDVDRVSANSFCKLRITAIRTVHTTWYYDTSGLVLPHRDNAIRIEFAGISYRSAGDITYRYCLKGLNDTWQTTRETFLSYPTLPSGQYELQLIAINKFGVKSDPISLTFSVERLLWEKAWFIFMIAAVIAGIVWVLVRIRIQQLHRKNEEKLRVRNRMAELEQMSLKAQMNPHFIFNSLNSIQKYVMEKDIKGVNKFITDFARLIRLTLEITSKSRISIDEEINYISNYLELEKARFNNTFQYHITLSPGIDRFTYYIPPMILQPYVENSIRHGVRNREDDNGHIDIRFAETAAHLVCTIEDNGVGREQSQQYKSLMPIEYQSRGMTLTARRMEMIGNAETGPMLIDIQDIYLENRQPGGTRVTLSFPIQYVKKTNLNYDQRSNYR